MKIILKITLKIIIFFAIFIIPVTVFITLFSLSQKNIPLWNIGIRNIIRYSTNYYIPSIFISYLISTLVSISIVDKIKVKSIFLLHIPPLLIAILLVGITFYIENKKVPFRVIDRKINIGLHMFFKEDVFNDTEDNLIYVKKTGRHRYSFYIYNKEDNKLNFIKGISTVKDGKNSISFNPYEKHIYIKYLQNNYTKSIKTPFKNFEKSNNITKNKFILFYSYQIKELFITINKQFKNLTSYDPYIFVAAVFISIFLISVPLSYLFNDSGWGFAGIIGVILIIIILPLSYNGIFKLLEKVDINSSFLGGYSYLFPLIIIAFIGVMFDIIAKVKR